MSGFKTGDSSDDQARASLPRIVEQTNGATFALAGAWVLFHARKFVLAFDLDDAGNVKPDDLWCTEELRSVDGSATYNDTYFEQAPGSWQDWIWKRLEAIDAGEAVSGPLFADGLPRIVSESGPNGGGAENFALAGPWVEHGGVRYVLLFELGDDGSYMRHFLRAAIQTGQGDSATYAVLPFGRLYPDAIEDRLAAILEGTAQSGTLE